jgi:hypothetical protein
MKQKLSVITALFIVGAFLFVCTSSAIPPMPSSSYTGTGADNITTTNLTATSANITTLTAASSNTTGVMAANVINASGTLTAVPSSTSPIMFGNTTPVNTSTGATFATADKTQIDKTGAFTNAAVGDLIIVTGGTGATTGQYRLTTRTSADSVKVDRNIHASGTDITDGAFTVYKDVVTLRQTDGTNGQMITGWSHTNKPLQIGGSSLLTAPTSTVAGNGVLLAATAIPVATKLYMGSEHTFITSATSASGADLLTFSLSETKIGVWSGAITGFSVYHRDGTNKKTSGTVKFAQILPQYDQESGTANNYDFLVNRTEFAVGTGTQRLISAGTGGNTYVEKFGVDNGGYVYSIPAQITSGTGTGVTVNSSGNVAQQVYKVTTTYAAYSDTDTTKGIVIATLPAKTRLVAAYADTTAAYTGGTVSAATLEVGVTAEGGAEILAAHNVLAGAILAGDTDAEMGTGMTRAAKEQGAYMPSFTGTTAVYATIDTTDGNLNALTTGSTTFYLITERLP